MARNLELEIKIQNLIRESYSRREIGDMLGLSRNQLAGICYRAGIGKKKSRDAALSLGASDHLTGIQHDGNGMTASPRTREPKPRPDYRVIQHRKGIASKPYVEKKTNAVGMALADTGNSNCRWMYGKNKSGQHICCGKPTFGKFSYCADHSTIAYMTVTPRRIAAEVPVVERVL